jgi:hypothetical protein
MPGFEPNLGLMKKAGNLNFEVASNDIHWVSYGAVTG